MSNSVNQWTVVCQVPLSVGIPRQEYWSGLPFPTSQDLPDPGVKPSAFAVAPMLQANSLPAEPRGKYIGKYRRIFFCPWGKEGFPKQDLKITTARINN